MLKRQGWDYRDPKAPHSPWGKIQDCTTIQRGVRMVETAGHGGLMVAKGVAEKELTPKARSLAERYGNYFCFEEDCLADVAFLERPEWLQALYGDSKQVDKEEIRKSVKYWYPQYFECSCDRMCNP